MMLLRKIYLFAALLISALTSTAQQWQTDTLGGHFQVRYFDQGTDYSGHVISSLVRLKTEHPDGVAALYIHGFNDYFFQTEMAEKFVEHGYAFYAVDLRKYGRSLLPGQKRCQVRNLKEYFPDIDSAMNVIRSEGFDRIVLIGHSTGGLVASFYMAHHPDVPVDALILNSPFLDWNLGRLECFINPVSAMGAVIPGLSFKSGSGTAYGESLCADYHGEWHFNRNWKSIEPTVVDLGWVRAINSAQHYLREHKYAISVPILLMYSSKSIDAKNWSPEVNSADAVLDVRDIRKYGLMLGKNVTAIAVAGGMHDLVLSAENVREPLYIYIFDWLEKEIRQ